MARQERPLEDANNLLKQSLTSMVKKSVALVMSGKRYRGSGMVRSTNQSMPPVLKLSMGKLAIPRRAKKKLMNTGACTTTSCC